MKSLALTLLIAFFITGCGMTGTSEKRAAATKDKIADQQGRVVDNAIETTGSSVSRGVSNAIENAIGKIFN